MSKTIEKRKKNKKNINVFIKVIYLGKGYSGLRDAYRLLAKKILERKI